MELKDFKFLNKNKEKFDSFEDKFKKFLKYFLVLAMFHSSFANENRTDFKNNLINNKNIEKTIQIEEKLKEEKIFENKIFKKLIDFGFEAKEKRDIEAIILHNVYYPFSKKDIYNLDKILLLFKKYNVSSHYFIDREGNIYQLVLDKDIAYHAGQGKIKGENFESINEVSLGIELANKKGGKITQKQYESLVSLVKYLKNKYEIKYILGHKDIAPKRKSDPWGFNLKQFLEDLKK